MAGDDPLKKILILGMVISLILSVAFLAIGFAVKSAPSRYQDIIIGLTNAVILGVGFGRIRSVSDDKNFGRIASQHLWIVFSLSTAVLSLLFGTYFYPGSATIKYLSIAIVSIISIVTLIVVVDAAINKVPIFD